MAITWRARSNSRENATATASMASVGATSAEQVAETGFDGKLGEIVRLSKGERSSHATVGLGNNPDATALRVAGAALARASRHVTEICIELPAVADISVAQVAVAVIEGFGLASYQFLEHKSEPKAHSIEVVELVHEDTEGVERAIALAEPAIAAVTLARDLANQTPARMTARHLADVAIAVASRCGLAVEVWDEARIEQEKLGCLISVNAGSAEPARVIRLDYLPEAEYQATGHVVLVGKGITFDSGGLSLKKPDGMYDMKGDMGGAAAVIGVMSACAELGIAVRVTGLVMATDNMPGPNATKPGEIVSARNGTTVEILDTDAEGRLVLADGLCLAAELAPTAIIDIATLTGYARVLGTHFTPVMSNDTTVCARIKAASVTTGEPIWELPLPEALATALVSPLADLRNIPDPDDAGTIAPGLFLKAFVGGIPWAHLDIGETGFASKDEAEITKGCTGVMVRTLLEMLRNWE